MIKIKTILCAVFALTIIGRMLAGDNVTLSTIDYVTERLRVRFEISAEVARKTPKWDGASVLPLPLERAVEIAKRSILGDMAGMQLSNVCLRAPVKGEAGVAPMFYLITFVPREVPMKRPTVSAVVLLDGTVVEGKNEKIEIGLQP